MTTKHYALLATRAAVRSGLTEQQLEHVASGHSRLGLRALIARYEVETYRVPLWRRCWVAAAEESGEL